MGAVSGSGTSPMVGISLGMSYEDKQCESRANAAAEYVMGNPMIAQQIMCQLNSVKKAAEAAGQPCDKAVVRPASVSMVVPPKAAAAVAMAMAAPAKSAPTEKANFCRG